MKTKKIDFLKDRYLLFSLFIIFITFILIFIEPNNFQFKKINLGELEIKENDNQENLINASYVKKRLEILQTSYHNDLRRLENRNFLNKSELELLDEILRDSLKEKEFFYSSGELENLYSSFWHINKMGILIQMMEFNYYTMNIQNNFKKSNSFFYYYSHEDLEFINKTTIIDIEDFLNEYESPYGQNISEIIIEINQLNKKRYFFYREKREISKFHSEFEDNYQFQKKLFYLKIIFSIFCLGIFFILGRYSKKITITSIKNKFSEVENILLKIKSFFFPEEISNETIKEILKLSSISSVILGIIGLMISIMGLNSGIFIIFLISIILNLSSIIIGVYSINSDSQEAKKAVYYLFMISIFGIIFLLIEFIVISGLINLWNLFKDAYNLFLIK